MRRIIIKDGEGVVVEKKSRFIGEIHKVSSETEAQDIVAAVRKKYYDARHHCYAYIIGTEGEQRKFSDDGEPGGTAGMPMLTILEGKNLTDCVAVVTRYFGGTLLGTGGLVRAYSAATEAALEDAAFAEKIPAVKLLFATDFKNEGVIRRICSNSQMRGVCLEIEDVSYSERCEISVNVELGEADALEKTVVEGLSGQVDTDRQGDVFIIR